MKLFNTKKSSQQKVAVGLSGGVDSAVVAYLLKQQGFDVTGVYMQCWESKADGCVADEDRMDAVKVASKLKIPFKHLHFEKEYKEKVITHFYNEYRAGRTPNPDVWCNKEIKFGMFLDWAMKKGFDFVATGHYAKVFEKDGIYFLEAGEDKGKDQSYFLYLLNQEQLSKAIFPLGEMKKDKVRELAKEVGFHNAYKKDSVGICFVGEVDIKEFLQKEIKFNSGNVVKTDGEIIGKHDGAVYYTIGQRHGFTVSKYQGIPMYVIAKDVEKNELVVGPIREGLRGDFEVEEVHWINEPFEGDAKVRIRHLGELLPAKLAVSHDGNSVNISLVDPAFGVAPGQSAVFYKDNLVLGGGTIR